MSENSSIADSDIDIGMADFGSAMFIGSVPAHRAQCLQL